LGSSTHDDRRRLDDRLRHFHRGGRISRQTALRGIAAHLILTGLLTCRRPFLRRTGCAFPHAGGQYVYLREAYSPLWDFCTLDAFLVIQTGTIAAVAVGFARYLGVLFPSISPTAWIIPPVALSSKYAISLSVQQLVGILMMSSSRSQYPGRAHRQLIQNIFTSAKTLALLGLIFVCVFIGRNAAAISDNFGHFWAVRGAQSLEPGANFLRGLVPTVTAASDAFGLFVAYGVAQVGSLFSATPGTTLASPPRK